MKKISVLLALAALTYTTNAAADFTLGAKAGTLGGGVEATKSLSPNFNLRLGVNKLDYDLEQESGGVRYDFTLDYQNGLVALDWHPFGGIFRLSIGTVLNNNEIRLGATPTGPQTIGGATYSAADIGTLSGDVQFKSNSPYVGLGWSKSPKGGFGPGFSLEIGALLKTDPEVTIKGNGGAAGNPQFEDDLQREAQEIEDDLGDVYPVISFSLSFGF